MRWTEHVAYLEEERVAYMVLLRKPVGNRPFGKLGVDWKIILKRDLREIGSGHEPDCSV